MNSGNPQLEDGHTRIANEILEVLARAGLNGTEWEIVITVLRKTYGWHKPSDMISLTQFEIATGKCRWIVCKALRTLLVNKILLVNKNRLGNEYSFNKRHLEWGSLKKHTSQQNDNQVVNKTTIRVVNKKRHTKETITKENTKERVLPFFELWNEQHVVVHRELTAGMEKELTKCLKEFSEEEVKQAIQTYGEVFRGEQYFFKYRWTFEEFLKREGGLRVFVYKKPENYLEFKSKKTEQLSGAEYFAKVRDQTNQ